VLCAVGVASELSEDQRYITVKSRIDPKRIFMQRVLYFIEKSCMCVVYGLSEQISDSIVDCRFNQQI
jgi:hypothetical protein